MPEPCFWGWDVSLGLVFGFGVVVGKQSLMVVQYLCTVVGIGQSIINGVAILVRSSCAQVFNILQFV